jgi:hypothetical protein
MMNEEEEEEETLLISNKLTDVHYPDYDHNHNHPTIACQRITHNETLSQLSHVQ